MRTLSCLVPKACLFQVIVMCVFAMTESGTALAQDVPPVLEFPQAGLDDDSTYRDYSTRFFRDSDGNTVQTAIYRNTGRVVNIWADAANESISFTARGASGEPAVLTWGTPTAQVFSNGETRYVQYELSAQDTSLDIGFLLLGSMRKEREFQYLRRHLLALDSPPFVAQELTELLKNVTSLPENTRRAHLALLKAENIEELQSRLVPQLNMQSQSAVLVEQLTFEGRNRLSLELSVPPSEAVIEVSDRRISIRSLSAASIQLTIKLGTDSPSLTPLKRDKIFNSDFTEFYERLKSEFDSLRSRSKRLERHSIENQKLVSFQRLDRQVKSLELLSSEEKLMAGLPNFATYFGRDMIMSALMMEPICSPSIVEHVIATVLRKLSPDGEVSHEESLGGQAIREHAAKYNGLIQKHIQSPKEGGRTSQLLTDAERVLRNLQAVKEDYRMLDDDFQLPVLVARYLARPDVTKARKRQFLLATLEMSGVSRLTLLLRNLMYVSNRSHAYVENPTTENLIAFPKIDDARWFAGSWRDSDPGYANGRFAMDINAVWVPKALESVQSIFAAFNEMGISIQDLEAIAAEVRDSKLIEYARKPDLLTNAINTWNQAVRQFEVHLSSEAVQKHVQAKLQSLPEEERFYWSHLIEKRGDITEDITFLALSLDEKGQPIPVANTDPATWLFLEHLTTQILQGEVEAKDAVKWLRIFVTPYPVGLFLDGVGPLASNDVYASSDIWERFRSDPYHSPRTVWGREVNLFLLGLAKQIAAAFDAKGQIKHPDLVPYVQELRSMLTTIRTSVESSGLKYNELWSYEISKGKLLPARYPTTSDIQLWNLTDLAVQFILDKISIYEL